jgi:hypothetical protein
MTYQYADPRVTIPLEIAFYRDRDGSVKYLNIFGRTLIKKD